MWLRWAIVLLYVAFVVGNAPGVMGAPVQSLAIHSQFLTSLICGTSAVIRELGGVEGVMCLIVPF